MKAFTDIEQSKKLAKILPIDSADMKFPYFGDGQYGTTAVFGEPLEFSGGKDIPAWSLVAIMELLPYDIKGHNLVIHKSYCPNEKFFAYDLSYEGDFVDYELSILVSTSSINLIDCCYEMILKLKEKDLL